MGKDVKKRNKRNMSRVIGQRKELEQEAKRDRTHGKKKDGQKTK